MDLSFTDIEVLFKMFKTIIFIFLARIQAFLEIPYVINIFEHAVY